MADDISLQIQEQVQAAAAAGTPLQIVGSDTKAFFGRDVGGQPLPVSAHAGVINYEPTELVVTARCGTRLSALEVELEQAGQMLAFEPPHFGADATLGGTLACALAGPRRPYAGAARDFILGTRIVNGHGQILRFGGEVMKNVAGYDVSRLMVGALGTLGVILDASIKVLPRPHTELTLVQQTTEAAAIERLAEWAGQPLPLSAGCFQDGYLRLRLSGTEAGVCAAQKLLGGDVDEHGGRFWSDLREHRLAWFDDPRPLWRLSLPAHTPPLEFDGAGLLDWGGAQRWLLSESPPDAIFETARWAGGHAALFRGGDRSGEVFAPLAPGLKRLQQRLKQSFDPARVFNPCRMYADL